MRFAAASKNNASNYATAGAHIINASTDIQQAIANHKPDYTGIAITAMDAASLENQAALKAETAVNTAGLKAVAGVKQAKLTADSRAAAAQSMADAEINVAEMNADVQKLKDKHRMAGKLSALGTLAAKTAIKRKKVDPPKFDGVDLSTDIAETTAKIAKLQKEIDAFNSGTEVATEPTIPTTGSTPTTSQPLTSSSSGALSNFVTGNTGRSTGPHLDFRVWSKSQGRYVDPRPHLQHVTAPGGGSLLDSYTKTSPYLEDRGSYIHQGIDFGIEEGTTLDVHLPFTESKWDNSGGGNMSIYQLPDDDLELVLLHGA